MALFIYIISIALIALILFFIVYYISNKRKLLRKLNLLKIDEQLKEKYEKIISRKTRAIFLAKRLYKKNKYFEQIIFENKSFYLNKGSISLEIYPTEEEKKNNISIIKHIELKKNEKRKKFRIEIYLFQENYFDLFIDLNEDETYSIETIFYSNSNELLPITLNIKEKALTLKDFGIQKMKVNNIINLIKDDCIEYINSQSSLKIDTKNPIFNKKNNNLLLNTRIININKKESNLFLFDIDKEIYNLQKSDIILLNKFFNLIIQPCILPYSKYEFNKIPKNIKNDFKKKFEEFIQKEKIKNKNKKHASSNISLKNDILNESNIPLQINYFNSINSEKNISVYDNSLIIDSNNKNNSVEDNNFITDSKEKNNSDNLKKAETIIDNFLSIPLNKRYIDQPSNNDIVLAEKICYLGISIKTCHQYKTLLLFQKLKEKIFKKVKTFNNKEKLKVIFTIYCHLIDDNIITDLDIIKMTDLPQYSPYFQGEILYRKIITNLTNKSKLNFILLQLQSGAGYDYINNINCYKIKIIPTLMIKYYLLSNYTNYFFRFWDSSKSSPIASTDGFTQIESINENKAFGKLFWNNKNIPYIESPDNSIKFCFLQLHEKGGHQSFKGNEKMENSPRYLFTNDLILYDNLDLLNKKGRGESGNAIEFYLFDEKNYFLECLLECENLEKLSDINLFTQKNNKLLVSTIENIISENKLYIAKGEGFKKKYQSRINLNEEEIIDPYTLSKMTYHELGIYKLH